MTDRDEIRAWLRLLETPGVGRAMLRALLAAFGSPEDVLGASIDARAGVVGRDAATALAAEPPEFAARFDAACRWLDGAGAGGRGPRALIAIGDPRYPQALLETADPPLVLYTLGRVDRLGAPSIAVVGSRNPTAQGLENARAFSAHLSRSGWTVVSGLALGIDGAAHEGALEGRGGTIAVVGTGLDVVYPSRHRALAERIADAGLLVSEFAIGTPSLPANFPVRNRIIAGLSRGTLVVEAAVQSGSLITARLAAEAGRDVFAIPGSIHSPLARGCHALIKQGAKLVDAVGDIVDELGGPAGVGAGAANRSGGNESPAAADAAAASRSSSRPLTADGQRASAGGASRDPLLEALGFDPVGLDELIARTGQGAAELSARLLELELQGRVARLPGQQFQRVERA